MPVGFGFFRNGEYFSHGDYYGNAPAFGKQYRPNQRKRRRLERQTGRKRK